MATLTLTPALADFIAEQELLHDTVEGCLASLETWYTDEPDGDLAVALIDHLRTMAPVTAA